VRRQSNGFAQHILRLRSQAARAECRCYFRHLLARYTRVATKTISNTPSPLDRLRLEVVPPG
jgi:hypothetical protein